MGTKNPKIDDYIAKSAEFARPILTHIRELVHKACPTVEEDLKWGHPFYMYKGPLCMSPAFKKHCSFGFWGWKVVQAKVNEVEGTKGDSLDKMKRITSVKDLPADKVLVGYIKLAADLKDTGVKTRPRPKPKVRVELVAPGCLTAALKKNAKARETFENFSYSHKKEYIEWINDAKTEETRNRRLTTMLGWLVDGKSRNWKYQNC
jgi:uncharacterized protein YdeI (YjbR/CyaY-like superfamily)